MNTQNFFSFLFVVGVCVCVVVVVLVGLLVLLHNIVISAMKHFTFTSQLHMTEENSTDCFIHHSSIKCYPHIFLCFPDMTARWAFLHWNISWRSWSTSGTSTMVKETWKWKTLTNSNSTEGWSLHVFICSVLCCLCVCIYINNCIKLYRQVNKQVYFKWNVFVCFAFYFIVNCQDCVCVCVLLFDLKDWKHLSLSLALSLSLFFLYRQWIKHHSGLPYQLPHSKTCSLKQFAFLFTKINT